MIIILDSWNISSWITLSLFISFIYSPLVISIAIVIANRLSCNVVIKLLTWIKSEKGSLGISGTKKFNMVLSLRLRSQMCTRALPSSPSSRRLTVIIRQLWGVEFEWGLKLSHLVKSQKRVLPSPFLDFT
jgi:hypothetical protein